MAEQSIQDIRILGIVGVHQFYRQTEGWRASDRTSAVIPTQARLLISDFTPPETLFKRMMNIFGEPSAPRLVQLHLCGTAAEILTSGTPEVIRAVSALDSLQQLRISPEARLSNVDLYDRLFTKLKLSRLQSLDLLFSNPPPTARHYAMRSDFLPHSQGTLRALRGPFSLGNVDLSHGSANIPVFKSLSKLEVTYAPPILDVRPYLLAFPALKEFYLVSAPGAWNTPLPFEDLRLSRQRNRIAQNSNEFRGSWGQLEFLKGSVQQVYVLGLKQAVRSLSLALKEGDEVYAPSEHRMVEQLLVDLRPSTLTVSDVPIPRGAASESYKGLLRILDILTQPVPISETELETAANTQPDTGTVKAEPDVVKIEPGDDTAVEPRPKPLGLSDIVLRWRFRSSEETQCGFEALRQVRRSFPLPRPAPASATVAGLLTSPQENNAETLALFMYSPLNRDLKCLRLQLVCDALKSVDPLEGCTEADALDFATDVQKHISRLRPSGSQPRMIELGVSAYSRGANKPHMEYEKEIEIV